MYNKYSDLEHFTQSMKGGVYMKKKGNEKCNIGIKKYAVMAVILSMITGNFMHVHGKMYEYYSLDMTSRELTKQIMNSETVELESIPYEEIWMKEDILSNIFNEMQVEKILRADKPVAFYAEMVDLWENPNGYAIHVDGLDSNDLNHKYEFICNIDDETFLSGWDKITEIDDFEIGDLIYIMYDGYVEEKYPCGIDHVYSVTLLDNENESIRKRIENDDVVNIDIIDENDFALKASNTYTTLADIRFDLCPAGKDDLSDGMRTATGITHRYRVDFEAGFMEKFDDVVKEMNVVLKWKGGTHEYKIPVKRESFTLETNGQDELEPDKNRRKLIVVKDEGTYLLVSGMSNASNLFEISKYEDCEPGDVLEVYGSLDVMEIYPGQMDIDGYDIVENSKASMDVIDCALRWRNFV